MKIFHYFCECSSKKSLVQHKFWLTALHLQAVTSLSYNNTGQNLVYIITQKISQILKGNFFIMKPTRCTNFTNLLWHETPHVSDSSSVHHQEFIHCTLNNGICHTGTVHTTFEQDQDGTAVPSWTCSKAVYKPVWLIPLLSVQWINSWWWTEELSETCGVSCHNKFVKLMHPVGFIIKKFVTMHGHMNTKKLKGKLHLWRPVQFVYIYGIKHLLLKTND